MRRDSRYMRVMPEGYTREIALKSVGIGWAALINRIFDVKPEQTLVVQVKEKFGGLRVYAHNTTPEFEAVICAAELESFKTCELCGAAGQLRNPLAWKLTLCDDCYKQKG